MNYPTIQYNTEYTEELSTVVPNYLKTVTDWLKTHTYDSSSFCNLKNLFYAKKNNTISLVIPTLNEEDTIEYILKKVLDELNKDYKIIDEIIVIDGGSTDDTVKIVRQLIFQYPILQLIDEKDILSKCKHKKGKGNQLWKGLYCSSGDIVLYCDSDIKNFEIHMIYGLIGPLLLHDIKLIKGFYERPLVLDDNTRKTNSGGRVTELCARPMLNLFYPLLSGFIQPLGGEYGGYREILENLEYTSGYGVEVSILIDTLEKYGIDNMGQVDLFSREHRHQNTNALSKMSFIILNTILKKNINANLNNDLLMKKFEKSSNIYEKNNITGDIDINEHFTLIQDVSDDVLPPIKSLIKQPTLINNYVI